MPEFSLKLSAPQMTKLKKDMPFQMTHSALSGDKETTHTATVMLTDMCYKKVQSAIRRGKGLRINPANDISEVMSGGKISLKKVGRVLKNVGRNYILPATVTVAKPVVRAGLGIVSQEVLGNPQAGYAVADAGFNALDKSRVVPKQKSKILDTIARQAGNNAGNNLTTDYNNYKSSQSMEGSGVGQAKFGGRFLKGSSDAKNHMAHLRSLRAKVSGGSFK
jgi:hypothetical protein